MKTRKEKKKVQIGNYTLMGENCTIEDDVTIGPFCEIYDNVHIKKGTILQGRNRIAPNCIIGENCTLKNGATLTNHVTLKKNIFMGPNSIILGDDSSRNGERPTTVEENTSIGAGSIVKAGKNICSNVTIGAMTFVNTDIKNSGTYVGVPVKNKAISIWRKDAFRKSSYFG